LSRESNAPTWTVVARVLIVALVPLVLFLTSLRLLLTDAFIQIEYRLPGFPEDSYGFTLEDRLHWAPIALDYLVNNEGIDFLGDLEFDDGSDVYNQRELRHMIDVKQLTQLALGVWAGGLACVIILGTLLYINGYREELWRSLRTGALVIFWFIVILAIALVVSFSFVFVGFHLIFFEGDTWLFLYSDTLIRLFPTRFWRDVFIFIVALTLSMTALTYLFSARKLKILGSVQSK
jgi:integral membrane protein (TIGR01906 family)